MTNRSIETHKFGSCLLMNERLMNVFTTMIGVIRHRSLDLKFEFDCGGFLLHNYTPEDEDEDVNYESIDIGLRINIMGLRLNVSIHMDRLKPCHVGPTFWLCLMQNVTRRF